MNEDLIPVLWVEDDPSATQTYPMEAAHFGLQLVPFCCWKDAEEALKKDFNRWSAIILDAKCKYKHDSHDNASTFLTQAFSSISEICIKNNRIIPWFVLSGGNEEDLNDLIIDKREEWDDDWNSKKYYSKTTDRKMLFHRIPYKVKRSPVMQIRVLRYPDVFKAIKNIGLDPDVENHMEDLLLPIHTDNFNYKDGKEYNDKMTSVRKCIELIFHSMAKYGILPNKEEGGKLVMADILTDRRGGINATWCSKIIAGQNITDKKGENVLIESSKNILPNVLKDSFRRLIEISAAYEHAVNKDANEEQKANSRDTSIFLESVNNAPYLLRGMTMELCNIILWYDGYLVKHKMKK